MKKIKVYLTIGLATCRHDDVIEVEDDATQEDIDQAVHEWAHNYIDFGGELADA